MMALQVYGIEKEFEGIPVLTGCSFDLAAGEKVGLVGANGSGKSTLMKILAGELTPDGGSAHWVHPDLTRGYLVQQGHLDPDRTLKSQLGPVPADLLSRCGVTPAMLAQKAGSLSGGQKVRAALARVLARRPEVLLLDEPTSHLDADGLRWLEELLAGYRGTVLAISHDRAFLDKVTTRILEMEAGQVHSYPGNYSAYARLKQAELERQMEEYRQYRAEKVHIEAAIRRQRQWSITGANQKIEAGAPMGQYEYNQGQAKSHMQKVKSMEKRLERIRVEKPRDPQRLNLRFGGGGHVGRHLAQASGLGFRYGEGPWLFRSADFFVERGERVALVGPNGSGKTTLLKLLVGDLEPTEGRLHRSPVRTAYLAQELEHLDPRNTVLQEAASGNTAADQPRVRTLLGCLLFSRDEVVKPVAVLSGGEKVRLAIAKILLSDPDLLVLDEPTNGLDLPSRERVEEALESYAGTLLLVSHDRYLLSRLATRVISIQGGRLEPFPGPYDQFLRRHERPAGGDPDERRLLLETRLSQLSALLAAPPEGEGERLTAEFIEVSRELRSMRRSTP